MINILLVVQLIVGALLIMVVMLQKTSNDGLSGLSGSNMGLMSIKEANRFLLRTTIILALIFMTNSILLANLSGKQNKSIISDIEEVAQEITEKDTIPVNNKN